MKSIRRKILRAATTMTSNTDRLSNLPDSLICHILSFLETKTSVATSILSRRWRYLWQYLDIFAFNGSWFLSPTPYIPFINSVLTLRKLRHIRKFRLSCQAYDEVPIDYVMIWVRAAIGPHIEELELDICSSHLDDTCPLYLPSCERVFSCPALVSLVLYGQINFGNISSFHLPSLKKLRFDCDTNNCPIDVLISGCPVLETLDYSAYYCEFGARFCLVSSSLRSLYFNITNRCEIEKLEIRIPSLEYLNIWIKGCFKQFLLCDLPNLVEAHLNFSHENQTVSELLMPLRTTKTMMLGCLFTKSLLGHASILKFPKFCWLLHLRIDMPRFNLEFIMELLCCCKMLQVLQISPFVKGGFYSSDSSCTLADRIQKTSVPTCVMSHLTTVLLHGYAHAEDERIFVTYILQNGLVLKTMEIKKFIFYGYAEKDHILKSLREIPRGSNLCQLKLVETDCTVVRKLDLII